MRKLILLITLLFVSACSNDPYAEAKKYLESPESGIERQNEIDYWQSESDSIYRLIRDEKAVFKEYIVNFNDEVIIASIEDPNGLVEYT